MPVNSIEEVRLLKEQMLFNQEVDELRSRIKERIHQLDMDKTPGMEEANCYLADKIEKLLDIRINNKQTLDYVEWVFNEGNFRTEKEITERNESINNAYYLQSGLYESDCVINNTLWGAIAFLLGFLLIAVNCDPIFIPVGIFIGGIFWLITGAITRTLNIRNAQKHNIPMNHPAVFKERVNRGICVGGLIGVTGTTMISTHKKAKELADVDGWKQMK